MSSRAPVASDVLKALGIVTIMVAVAVIGRTSLKANRSATQIVTDGPRRLVTQATCDLINYGMTKEDVTKLLGRPPDLKGESYVMLADDKVGRVCRSMDTWTWKENGKWISVIFAGNERVFGRSFTDKNMT